MSLSALSIDFRGKRFEYFRNIYHAIHCAAGWLIQLNCQAQMFLLDIMDTTSLSVFVEFFAIVDHGYCKKAIYLYRDVGFFHQVHPAYVYPFFKFNLLMNNGRREQTLSSPRWALCQKEVNVQWFSFDS